MSEWLNDELAALTAKASVRDPETGRYYHWTDAERDRVFALIRRRYPAIQYAPSTEEMAARFGHLARLKGQTKGGSA